MVGRCEIIVAWGACDSYGHEDCEPRGEGICVILVAGDV